MKTAAIYARVSREEQAERYGLAAQLTDLRALAAKRGYVVPDGAELVDDGYSGATLERPALTRLRDSVRAGAFDVILVSDPDRLARNLTLQLVLIDEIERHGVKIEFLTTPRDDSPDSRLLFNVLGVIAEFEREKIRERTMRGRREKLRLGRLALSVPPLGYRIESDRLVPFEPEAQIVRTMFSWLVQERRPLRSIARELQALGIRTRRGGPWRISTVRKILVNPVYAGTTTYRAAGETFTLSVPALVSPAVWQAAQEQLRRNRALLQGRPTKRFYLLAGLVRCGLCGRRMAGSRYRYECTNRDRVLGNGCRTAVSRPRLEAAVWEAVASVLRNPARLAEHFTRRAEKLGIREVEVRSLVEHLRRQHAELGSQQQRLIELWAREDLSEDDKAAVAARLAELGRHRRAVAERLERAEREAQATDSDQAKQEAVRRFCAQARRGLVKLNPEGRQKLLRTLIDSVTVRGTRVEISGVLPAGQPGTETVHVATASW